MKKVAILHFAYSPNIGGVEKLVEDQANILAGSGFAVRIITGNGQKNNNNIEVVSIPEFQSVMNFNPVLQKKMLEQAIFDEEFKQLSELIGKKLEDNLSDIDTIIIHNMLTISRNLPFIDAFNNYANNHKDKKIIVWVHDHMYIKNNEIVTDTVRTSNLEYELITTPLNNAQYVSISETLGKSLIEVMSIPKANFHVIPNGINIKSFLEIDDSIWNITEEYNLLNKFPLILSPINILERKNIEFSLKLITKLKKYYPNIFYVVSGKASQHRDTQFYFNSIVEIVNRLDLNKNILFLSKKFQHSLANSELHDLYDLSDAIFYFSKSENFGIPILEAGATKTPIFTSDIEIFREIGKDNIFHLDTDDLESASRLIFDFFENNKGSKLFKEVKMKYNLEIIIKEKLIPLI
jgi:glycosyltransferase involved in cell wall biosynthesis